MNGPNLVNDPMADAFRNRHSTNSGMKATIGDPDKHDGPVRAAINNAHNAAREVLASWDALDLADMLGIGAA